MTAARLLLTADDLARLRQSTGVRVPPGFALSGDVEGPLPEQLAHPAVAADLDVLSRPELAVLVRASRPGLAVTACLAVRGVRGAGLLRTGDGLVRLSAFRAADLARELTGVVPADDPDRPASPSSVLPLEVLLGPAGSRLHGRAAGALRAVVVDASGQRTGSVDWVWDGTGWTALEALPSRDGRPWVRLHPVRPADLARSVAPLLAAAA